jgi:hypothetical protein
VYELPAGFAPATTATAAAVSTTAATVAAAAATAESTALGAGTRFVHVQRAAVQFLTVQGLDGFHGLGLIGHFDKGEAAGLAGVTIAHNAGLFHSAVRGKSRLELRLRGLISKVSNKNIRHESISNKGSIDQAGSFPMVGNWRARHVKSVSQPLHHVDLNQGALDELAPFVDPAAVSGADLVLVSRTYIGLQHHGGVGGLH